MPHAGKWIVAFPADSFREKRKFVRWRIFGAMDDLGKNLAKPDDNPHGG
jgi:hypothetical protein